MGMCEIVHISWHILNYSLFLFGAICKPIPAFCVFRQERTLHLCRRCSLGKVTGAECAENKGGGALILVAHYA